MKVKFTAKDIRALERADALCDGSVGTPRRLLRLIDRMQAIEKARWHKQRGPTDGGSLEPASRLPDEVIRLTCVPTNDNRFLCQAVSTLACAGEYGASGRDAQAKALIRLGNILLSQPAGGEAIDLCVDCTPCALCGYAGAERAKGPEF